MADKYLIINADDFGMCRAHNEATAQLFALGGISSATVMAPCPYAEEAVAFAKANPECAVGIHLTTTSEWIGYRWGAVSDSVPSLLDSQGCFYRFTSEFLANAKKEEVEIEIKAQTEKLLSLGLSPSHIDNHMGSLYGIESGDFSLLESLFRLAAEYRLPVRFPSEHTDSLMKNALIGIKADGDAVRRNIDSFSAKLKSSGIYTPDRVAPGDWAGEQDKSYENYREYIYELYRSFEPGITETYIHPAVECDELKNITPKWHRRVWEYKLFSDSKTKDFINSLGIKLISYRDICKIR